MKKIAPFLILILFFAVAAWYFFTRQPEATHEIMQEHNPPAQVIPSPPVEIPAEPSVVYTEPEPEPEVVEDPLPLLHESDAALDEALTEVVAQQSLTEFLVQDQVISRMVAMIDSLTSRQVPAQTNPVKSVDGKFLVETQGDRTRMSAKNFARYDAYISLLSDANTDSIMSVYQRYSPLFQQAWEENGQEGSFNDRLVEVIDSLLETPDVPGPVYLTKPEAVYVFEEPELEAMTAGQKILIRMGSVNASIVKQKLSEIRAGLVRQGA